MSSFSVHLYPTRFLGQIYVLYCNSALWVGGATGEEQKGYPFHCAKDSPWAVVKQMPNFKHVGP